MILTQEQIARLEQLKSKQHHTPSERAELEFLASAATDLPDDVEEGSVIAVLLKSNDTIKDLIKQGNYTEARETIDATAKELATTIALGANGKESTVHLELMKDCKVNVEAFAEKVLDVVPVSPKAFVNGFREILYVKPETLTVYSFAYHQWYDRKLHQVATKISIFLNDIPPYFSLHIAPTVALLALEDVMKEQRQILPDELLELVKDKEYTSEEYKAGLGLVQTALRRVLEFTLPVWMGSFSKEMSFYGEPAELHEVYKAFLKNTATEAKQAVKEHIIKSTEEVVEDLKESLDKGDAKGFMQKLLKVFKNS